MTTWAGLQLTWVIYTLTVTARETPDRRSLVDKPLGVQPTWVLYTLTVTARETSERRSLAR